MRFANPEAFYLLLLLPALLVFLKAAAIRRRQAIARFGNPALIAGISASVHHGKRRLKAALLLAGTTLLVLALARPQIGTRSEMVKRMGNDLVIALDTSLSMLAEDIKPNRLDKAKYEIAKLIDTLGGDRIGLVAFAGTAFLQCPLTLDQGAVKMFLDIVDTDIIPEPGTALSKAIDVARGAFPGKERKHKVLILLTDGEDHSGDPVAAAEEAAREGVRIYTVGLGSRDGAPIPVLDEEGRVVDHKRDRRGKLVMSRLNEKTLRKIALAADGKYYHAGTGEFDLGKVLDEIAAMEKEELESRIFTHYEDRFQWLLFPALLAFVAEGLITDGRKRRQKKAPGREDS